MEGLEALGLRSTASAAGTIRRIRVTLTVASLAWFFRPTAHMLALALVVVSPKRPSSPFPVLHPVRTFGYY